MFIVNTMAPLILYSCSALLFFLGVRRIRLGSRAKGVVNIIGAGAIAIMGWSIGNP